MRIHPFLLLRQFEDQLDVCFLTREDDAGSDDDIARITNASALASLKQVHGNRAVIVHGNSRRIEQADALATNQQGLTLTIRFADCQNFIVYDPAKNVLCLIHAGWRGLAAGVIKEAFALLKSEWSIDPKDAYVVAGPSLCTKCAEFTDPLTEAPNLAAFAEGKNIDLVRAADDELTLLGVPKENYERLSGCTCCSPEEYWTYRGGDREAVKAGKINCLAVTLL